MIEPPSVPESSTACMAMVASTSVDVEAGADRLADLAQRLELVDLARQLGAARLQLLHELDAVDRHRRLTGERRDDAPSRARRTG